MHGYKSGECLLLCGVVIQRAQGDSLKFASVQVLYQNGDAIGVFIFEKFTEIYTQIKIKYY